MFTFDIGELLNATQWSSGKVVSILGKDTENNVSIVFKVAPINIFNAMWKIGLHAKGQTDNAFKQIFNQFTFVVYFDQHISDLQSI